MDRNTKVLGDDPRPVYPCKSNQTDGLAIIEQLSVVSMSSVVAVLQLRKLSSPTGQNSCTPSARARDRRQTLRRSAETRSNFHEEYQQAVSPSWLLYFHVLVITFVTPDYFATRFRSWTFCSSFFLFVAASVNCHGKRNLSRTMNETHCRNTLWNF